VGRQVHAAQHGKAAKAVLSPWKSDIGEYFAGPNLMSAFGYTSLPRDVRGQNIVATFVFLVNEILWQLARSGWVVHGQSQEFAALETHRLVTGLIGTKSVSNYSSFDFFYSKFDHSS
jgi:hypothetical protein